MVDFLKRILYCVIIIPEWILIVIFGFVGLVVVLILNGLISFVEWLMFGVSVFPGSFFYLDVAFCHTQRINCWLTIHEEWGSSDIRNEDYKCGCCKYCNKEI